MNFLHRKLLLCFIFLIPTKVSADEWKGACESDYPPYNYSQNGKNVGMDTEIVELVMRNIKNVTFTFETFPWARVLKNLENNNINLAWQFIDVPERRNKFILVGPIRDGTTVFIVPNNSNIKDWKKLTDFKGKTIATVRGYKYLPEFDNAAFIIKVIPRYVGFTKKDADKAKLFQAQLEIEKSTLEYKNILQKYSN